MNFIHFEYNRIEALHFKKLNGQITNQEILKITVKFTTGSYVA